MQNNPQSPISRNDPKLAHSVANHQIKVGVDDATSFNLEMIRLLKTGKFMSVKDVDRTIDKHFSRFLLRRDIQKATGSRNKALWAFLYPDKRHNDYCIFLLELKKGEIMADSVAMRINAHAIARTYQRSTGNDDLKQVMELLRVHIGFMLVMLRKLRSGEMTIPYGFSTYTKDGKMLWEYEERRVIGKTWVSVDQFGATDLKRIKNSSTDLTTSVLGVSHKANDS